MMNIIISFAIDNLNYYYFINNPFSNHEFINKKSNY